MTIINGKEIYTLDDMLAHIKKDTSELIKANEFLKSRMMFIEDSIAVMRCRIIVLEECCNEKKESKE